MKFLTFKSMAAVTGLAALLIGGAGWASVASADEGVADVTAQVVEAERRRGGNRGQGAEALAEQLGVTVEELQAAREAAREAGIAQLVEDGWITAEEAEDGRVRLPRGAYYEPILDEEALFADALGISVAELEAAKEAVKDARIAEALEAGDITEEDLANREAIQAFKESIDQDAAIAEALGITVDELNAARDNTVTFQELLEQEDVTRAEFRENIEAIKDGLIEEAVANGQLTAEQAERLEEGGQRNRRGPRGNGGNRGQGGEQTPVAPTIDA